MLKIPAHKNTSAPAGQVVNPLPTAKVVTLADYVKSVDAAEAIKPVLPIATACRRLAIAADNFRRQTSRAEVDPSSRKSARSAGLLLDLAITAACDSLTAAAGNVSMYAADQRA